GRELERQLADDVLRERLPLLRRRVRAEEAYGVARAEVGAHRIPRQRLVVREPRLTRDRGQGRRTLVQPDRAERSPVIDARVRLVEELVAGLAGAQTPVDVLVIGEVRLVEEPDRPQRLRLEERTAADHHLYLPAAIVVPEDRNVDAAQLDH